MPSMSRQFFQSSRNGSIREDEPTGCDPVPLSRHDPTLLPNRGRRRGGLRISREEERDETEGWQEDGEAVHGVSVFALSVSTMSVSTARHSGRWAEDCPNWRQVAHWHWTEVGSPPQILSALDRHLGQGRLQLRVDHDGLRRVLQHLRLPFLQGLDGLGLRLERLDGRVGLQAPTGAEPGGEGGDDSDDDSGDGIHAALHVLLGGKREETRVDRGVL